MTLELVKPSLGYLPGYKDALERGWSPDNIRLDKTRLENLAKIAADALTFVSSLDDTEGKGEPVKMADGSTVKRLPGYIRWLWDGEFCGSIGFRWQTGTAKLPETCLGHIGYSVVPWKRRKGYATEALRLTLDAARQWLPYVEITTQPDNIGSQKTITANGGKMIEAFVTSPSLGGNTEWRYRIDLTPI